MSAKSDRKRRNKAAKQAEAKRKTIKSENDETMGTMDYRLIKNEEKPHIKFNDGDFAFTIQFTSLEDRAAGKGMLYSAVTARTMTDLSAEKFKAAYPVQPDPFWEGEKLNVMEKILREDFEAKLKGDVLFNDGEAAIFSMLLSNGEDGMDWKYRKDTNLTKAEFLKQYPVSVEKPMPASAAKKILKAWAEAEKELEANRPHFTFESTLPLLTSDAVVEIAGVKVVPLVKDYVGLLKFSDENGGTADFVDPQSYRKLASFDVVITDEMRQAKCDHPDCECSNNTSFDELLTGCASADHKDYDAHELAPVKLYAAFCDDPNCTEQHIWLLSECVDSGHTHREHYAQLRSAADAQAAA